MLAIAVRFPTGRYYAASHRDRAQPEWPPHPDRLFSALVSTCYQTGEGTGRSALEWLERQGPPALCIPALPEDAKEGRAICAMVSTNDVELRSSSAKEILRALPVLRPHQPRWFPSLWRSPFTSSGRRRNRMQRLAQRSVHW